MSVLGTYVQVFLNRYVEINQFIFDKNTYTIRACWFIDECGREHSGGWNLGESGPYTMPLDSNLLIPNAVDVRRDTHLHQPWAGAQGTTPRSNRADSAVGIENDMTINPFIR